MLHFKRLDFDIPMRRVHARLLAPVQLRAFLQASAGQQIGSPIRRHHVRFGINARKRLRVEVIQVRNEDNVLLIKSMPATRLSSTV